MGVDGKAKILSLDDLFKLSLSIPGYQRPYKWLERNALEMLDDMQDAIEKARNDKRLKYRFGTIILHKRNDGRLDIVDGQQRVLTLHLIKRRLRELKGLVPDSIDVPVALGNEITQRNIRKNYAAICERLLLMSRNACLLDEWNESFGSLFEVVVIVVEKESEAFQLFDSQNSRGKPLEPHDLLKAYHLREMAGDSFGMFYAVRNWESVDPGKIGLLFGTYLFAIKNWSEGKKTRPFTTAEIATFKGVPADTAYPYAKRVMRSAPSFQITEDFVAGKDFFEMTGYYLSVSDYLKNAVLAFDGIADVLNDESMSRSIGFCYATTLFHAAVLAFYDRFGVLDERVVIKLFIWAFMLRIDMKKLFFSSVNKYAVGGGDDGRFSGTYTNRIPMFQLIKKAKTVNEVASIPVTTDVSVCSDKWSGLLKGLETMNGKGRDNA